MGKKAVVCKQMHFKSLQMWSEWQALLWWTSHHISAAGILRSRKNKKVGTIAFERLSTSPARGQVPSGSGNSFIMPIARLRADGDRSHGQWGQRKVKMKSEKVPVCFCAMDKSTLWLSKAVSFASEPVWTCSPSDAATSPSLTQPPPSRPALPPKAKPIKRNPHRICVMPNSPLHFQSCCTAPRHRTVACCTPLESSPPPLSDAPIFEGEEPGQGWKKTCKKVVAPYKILYLDTTRTFSH